MGFAPLKLVMETEGTELPQDAHPLEGIGEDGGGDVGKGGPHEDGEHPRTDGHGGAYSPGRPRPVSPVFRIRIDVLARVTGCSSATCS